MLSNLPANPARRRRDVRDLGRATPGRPHHRLDCAGSGEAPVQAIAGLPNVSHPGHPNVTPPVVRTWDIRILRNALSQPPRDRSVSMRTIANTSARPAFNTSAAASGDPSLGFDSAPARPSVAPARPRRSPCAGSSDRQRPRPRSAFQGQGGAREHRDRSLGADQPFRPHSGIEHLGVPPVLAERPAQSRSEDSTIDEAERSLRIPFATPVDRQPVGCATIRSRSA